MNWSSGWKLACWKLAAWILADKRLAGRMLAGGRWADWDEDWRLAYGMLTSWVADWKLVTLGRDLEAGQVANWRLVGWEAGSVTKSKSHSGNEHINQGLFDTSHCAILRAASMKHYVFSIHFLFGLFFYWIRRFLICDWAGKFQSDLATLETVSQSGLCRQD